MSQTQLCVWNAFGEFKCSMAPGRAPCLKPACGRVWGDAGRETFYAATGEVVPTAAAAFSPSSAAASFPPNADRGRPVGGGKAGVEEMMWRAPIPGGGNGTAKYDKREGFCPCAGAGM